MIKTVIMIDKMFGIVLAYFSKGVKVIILIKNDDVKSCQYCLSFNKTKAILTAFNVIILLSINIDGNVRMVSQLPITILMMMSRCKKAGFPLSSKASLRTGQPLPLRSSSYYASSTLPSYFLKPSSTSWYSASFSQFSSSSSLTRWLTI